MWKGLLKLMAVTACRLTGQHQPHAERIENTVTVRCRVCEQQTGSWPADDRRHRQLHPGGQVTQERRYEDRRDADGQHDRRHHYRRMSERRGGMDGHS